MNAPDATARLCLACGLCCNGVLFKDVELQPGEDPARFKTLGLPAQFPRPNSRPARFPQPCSALCADNRCQIYANRPRRCREFECGVLKEVIADRLNVPGALKIIQRALRRAERVKSLLRQLGDSDEHRPLAQRFRRMRRRLESLPRDEETSDRFAELTLEVHQLNLLIHSRFHHVIESSS
jgi:uncharacterized protein